MTTHAEAYDQPGTVCITPYFPEEVVDFTSPEQVAECLIDNRDYDGYALMGKFSEADIMLLAIEDAQAIIANRQQVLQERQWLQRLMQSSMNRIEQARIQRKTVYSVSTSNGTKASARSGRNFG